MGNNGLFEKMKNFRNQKDVRQAFVALMEGYPIHNDKKKFFPELIELKRLNRRGFYETLSFGQDAFRQVMATLASEDYSTFKLDEYSDNSDWRPGFFCCVRMHYTSVDIKLSATVGCRDGQSYQFTLKIFDKAALDKAPVVITRKQESSDVVDELAKLKSPSRAGVR